MPRGRARIPATCPPPCCAMPARPGSSSAIPSAVRTTRETDELVREKVLAAVAAGLIPIVCVGETEEQRSSGQETEVVGWQLAGSLPKPFAGVVAYEPVWAIGTGKTATEQDVATMHAFIREELVRQFGDAGEGIRILYGGSMRPANAASLLAVPHVGGGLIGGASLKAEEFLAIARAARANGAV